MTRRRWVLVGAAIVATIALAAILWPRSSSTKPPAAPRRAGATVRISDGPAAARAPEPSADGRRRLPPPPPGFDPGTKPPEPGAGLDPRVAEALATGELPVTPPGFADDALRAQFRAWWLDEGVRRAEVYRQRFPSDTLPNDEETRQLLEEMYDAGEPPRDGEDADAVAARHQIWFERWEDFTAAYGEPPHGVFSYGGDPAFGEATPPPNLPTGTAPVPDTTRPHTEDDGARTPMGPGGPR